MLITRRSDINGKVRHKELNTTQAQIENYNRGMTKAAAFPDLDEWDAEFVISGLTAEDFDAMWEGK